MSVNESPLHFSPNAISRINSHIESRPANVKSAFKVSVVYQKEKILCQVGFDDYKLIRKTIFEYPVPVIISELDELFLRGSYIDFHAEEDSFFYYPDIHLEVLDRSGGSIFVFYLDRTVIAKDSPISSLSMSKDQKSDTHPLLIRKIFESNYVESIYVEKNFISIEKLNSISPKEFEETLSNIILSYFESCGYPLYITESKIEAKQIALL